MYANVLKPIQAAAEVLQMIIQTIPTKTLEQGLKPVVMKTQNPELISMEITASTARSNNT